jgi:hypothetical protein
MSKKHLRGLGAIPVLAAVIALAASSGATASPTASAAAVKKGCVPATSVEAIIDDSGSMSTSDPSKFRTALLGAFASINDGLKFGAVEFGSTADVLFAPARIPGVIPKMNASFSLVDANNGGTDYDSGFRLANSQNRTAGARIFLSDGLASPPLLHVHPKIKTFVVGLGVDVVSDPTAQAVLAKIAKDTGGPRPFLITDASQLQPVAGAITAAIGCGGKAIKFTDSFATAGQVVNHTFRAKGETAKILTTWPTTGVTITPTVGGAPRASVAKVRVTTSSGATFSAVKLKGLKRGKKVKFKVTATTLPTPTTATTQVIRSKAKRK